MYRIRAKTCSTVLLSDSVIVMCIDLSGLLLSCCYYYPMTAILGTLGKIPETYDVRRIVEALIQELVKEDMLQRNQIDFIIGKGKPKAAQNNEMLSDQSEI